MPQFNRVLEPDEKIVWASKPSIKIYTASRLVLLLPFILFGIMLVVASLVSPAYQGLSEADAQNRMVFMVIGLASIIIPIIVAVIAVNGYSRIAYAVTTSRILRQFPGKGGSVNIESTPFLEIKDMQINQGVFDLLFGGTTKTILFSTKDSYEYHKKSGWQHKPTRLSYVQNADEVLKLYHVQQPQQLINNPASEQVVQATSPSFLPKQYQESPGVAVMNQSQVLTSQALDVHQLPTAIANILKPEEVVLWYGRPKPLPFITHYLFVHVIALIILGLYIYSFINNPEEYVQNLKLDQMEYLLVSLILLIAPIIYRRMVYKRVLYVVTNQRVLVQGGVVGIDIESFERAQITNAQLKSNIIDRILGQNTATISLETYNRRNTAKGSIWWAGNELQHIQEANKVQNLIIGSS